jgi:NADPH-dependent 7-cyano-7-deazaguanine reductase QueF-like protein|tara:strand:- start:25963 stop:26364 length:402 start_codon:yes stop_codon:yes gene_type:complete
MKKILVLIIVGLTFILYNQQQEINQIKATKTNTNYLNNKNHNSNQDIQKKTCKSDVSGCRHEAFSYVKKLCRESGTWDPLSIDLWSRSAKKINSKEYSVEIFYPNKEGGPHTAIEVVKVDCDCNIISSRRKKW